MNKKHNTYNLLSSLHNIKLKLILEGIVVGLISGFLVVIYRLALQEAEELRVHIITLHLNSIKTIISYFLILMLLSLIIGYLIKSEPMISGSGIPQVEGILIGKLHMNWLNIIIKKFIGGMISIGAGLSLGREGPSIQLGAAVGQGVSRLLNRLKTEEKYLITSGASAGLSAAFNAPMAGVMFSLEEVHKHFSPMLLLSTMSASLTADFVSSHFFGLSPVFDFHHINPLPLNSYAFIIILGVIVGIFGVIYNWTLAKTQLFYDVKLHFLPVQLKPTIPFFLSGVLAIVFPQILGSGHSLMDNLIQNNFTIEMLLLILAGKFIFSMISFGSGAPGGIFFPLLVLGAFTGGIYGNALTSFCGLDKTYINNFVILAMAGYFAAIVRSPITGSILITEMTGSLSHFLSLSLVSITAYIIADVLNSKPVYEYLLDRLLNKRSQNNLSNSEAKILVEIPVCLNSIIDNKLLRNIEIPNECLLVSVRRGNHEIIPKGNTRIYSGDLLTFLINEPTVDYVNEKLKEITSSVQ